MASKVSAVPAGMRSVIPSLVVDGAAEAIDFIKAAFGAEEIDRAMDPSGKKVWHAALRIGDSPVFIGDQTPDMGAPAQPSRVWLYLEEVDKVFERAVSAGATVRMPPSDMFWGDRMGQVQDKWGNQWSIATHVKDMTPAEMQKAQEEFIANMKKGGG